MSEPKHQQKSMWSKEGSPCIKCIVRTTCTRSAIYGTACEEYVDFVMEQIQKMSKEK